MSHRYRTRSLLWVAVAATLFSSVPFATAGTIERIRSVEEGFAPVSLVPNEPAVKLNLRQLMEICNVSQMSIAVIDNYRIDWAKGYGATDDGRPVTTHTLFPACSISKPIATLAALRLVEEGKLALDDDVNQKLKSWKVPENELTREQKVTLRRVLTHTAGTLDHGFPGYEAGQPIPTLLQVLDGETPATTDPVRVMYVPGTKQSYSGGGFLILQQLMMDVTGERFAQIVQERVFDRLGLQDTTYEQTSAADRAATGRNRNGDRVPARVVPELAAGGVWTTPSDLARIVIDVALSKRGRSNRVLSSAMTREMLREQINPNIETVGGAAGGPQTRTGLGWFLGQESDFRRFEHTGVNIGFAAKLLMWDSGHGVIVMANNWSFETEVLLRYVINTVAKQYDWSYRFPTFTPWPYADTIVLAAAKLRGAQAAIAKYHELKQLSAGQKRNIGDLSVVWASDPPDYLPNEWDLYGVAQVIGDTTHIHDAIELMKVEIQDYPTFVPGYRYLGKLYERAGEKQLAIQTLERLLTLQPGDKEAIESLQQLQHAGEPPH